MKSTTLLVLAAGLGSRYKGQKQVDAISDGDESLMDFALYDAAKLGFDKFVFIINDQFPQEFRTRLTETLSKNNAEVHFVEQTLEKNIPEEYLSKVTSRKKPLGTAHAVLCAKDIINEPFVTINADDFYGTHSYETAFECVQNGDIAADQFAMVGFKLPNTLSENGTVSRGICSVDEGILNGVEEHTSIQKIDGVINAVNDETGVECTLSEDNLVSMNFWILDPSFFEFAKKDLLEFLKNNEDLSKKEFYLPAVVDNAIHRGEVKVKVLPTREKWFGLTYPDDKEIVMREVAAIKADKAYPEKLWA